MPVCIQYRMYAGSPEGDLAGPLLIITPSNLTLSSYIPFSTRANIAVFTSEIDWLVINTDVLHQLSSAREGCTEYS